jgi:pheromone shutdown protein TraB
MRIPDKEGKPGRIIMVGTSHIAGESVKTVREVIERENPDCVAVELDLRRLHGMRAGKGSMRDAFAILGLTNFIFFVIMRWVQGTLSRRTGILPGEEMLRAVDAAEERRIQVALVDRDMTITFERLRKVDFAEKFNLILFLMGGLVFGPILALFGKGRRIDLNRVPERELVREATEEIRNRFPGIYRVLIAERDRYIASRLIVISKSYKKTVAFVGAGHSEAVERIIRESRRP